jgi:hypothetical protein
LRYTFQVRRAAPVMSSKADGIIVQANELLPR